MRQILQGRDINLKIQVPLKYLSLYMDPCPFFIEEHWQMATR